MKITTVKRKYKNQWVLVEVLEANKAGEMINVNPIYAGENKQVVYKKLAKVSKGTHTAVFYTGQIKGTFTL